MKSEQPDPWSSTAAALPVVSMAEVILEAQGHGLGLSLLEACRATGGLGVERDDAFAHEVFQYACDLLAEHGYVQAESGWLRPV